MRRYAICNLGKGPPDGILLSGVSFCMYFCDIIYYKIIAQQECIVLEIKIKYLTDAIEPLRYIDGKSDWIDLRAAQTVTLKAGEFRLIPLGVAMELPAGYEAHIVPRSSTFQNFGIIQTNSMGIVDETYCGDDDQWFFPAYALRDTVIEAGDRICQFRIMAHQPQLTFCQTTHLSHINRGGHGSTGKA